jgi:hypothetical protein
MTSDRWAKYGSATGIVFVVLLIVGFFFVLPTPPDVDSGAKKFANYFADNQNSIRAGDLIISIALFFYIWFLGSLSSALRRMAGEPRLATVAFGGGIVSAGFILTALTVGSAAAFRPDETSPDIIRALADIGIVAGMPAFAGFAALLYATALVILRTGVLPSWLGWLCAAGAVSQLFTLGVVFTKTGVFAADGALGLIVPFFGFVIPVAALSIVLTQRADEGGGITGRVRGAVGRVTP